MKKILNTLILAAILVLSPVVASAQTAFGFTMATANSATNVSVLGGFSNNVNVSAITISVPAAATTNATFFFYDWFATRLTNLWSTNIVSYTNATVVDPYTNNVIFTNSIGRVQTNTYIGRATFYTNVTEANTTSSVPAIGAITAQPGVPITVLVNWNLAQGLAVRGTNNNPTSFITVTYQ